MHKFPKPLHGSGLPACQDPAARRVSLVCRYRRYDRCEPSGIHHAIGIRERNDLARGRPELALRAADGPRALSRTSFTADP